MNSCFFSVGCKNLINSGKEKICLLISAFFFICQGYSQNDEIIRLVFNDKSNFDITTYLGDAKPMKYYVLKTTDKWNSYRFHLNENIKSESVQKRLQADEHSQYNSTYIFKDKMLDRIINDNEKEKLFQMTRSVKPRQLKDGLKKIILIKSFEAARNGFFFSMTDPIFSTDEKFAFIDITIYKKEEDTKELRETYFGTTFLIYQHVKGQGWKRFKKINHLIL